MYPDYNPKKWIAASSIHLHGKSKSFLLIIIKGVCDDWSM